MYEKLLVRLTKYLNKIHNKNNTIDYWRIIIGPWLLIFLAVIYDRWKILENVLNEHKVTDVIVSKEKICDNEIFNMEHFILSIKSDYWNLGVFSDILNYRKDLKINYHHNNYIKNDLNYPVTNDISLTKIFCNIFYYFNIYQCHPQFYFIQTYLSKIQNIFLQIKLKQFPYFRKIFETDLCKKNKI